MEVCIENNGDHAPQRFNLYIRADDEDEVYEIIQYHCVEFGPYYTWYNIDSTYELKDDSYEDEAVVNLCYHFTTYNKERWSVENNA